MARQTTVLNKAFREQQHPQPLDHWVDNPFMGQQVGNCSSFSSTHSLANVFSMHCGPRASPLCVQHSIQLTSPTHSKLIDIPIPKIWILKTLTLKVQGQGWGQSQSHKLVPTSYRLTSFWFRVNPPFHSYDRAFFKFDPQNPRSKS